LLTGKFPASFRSKTIERELQDIIERRGDYALRDKVPSTGKKSTGSGKSTPSKKMSESARVLFANAFKDTEQLAFGWDEYKTQDGKLYYYHAEKKQTQWDRPVRKCAVAEFTFEAQDADELGVTEGEQVEIVEDSDPHWAICIGKSGAKGAVPKNYLKM
jgi:hypothetical protein